MVLFKSLLFILSKRTFLASDSALFFLSSKALKSFVKSYSDGSSGSGVSGVSGTGGSSIGCCSGCPPIGNPPPEGGAIGAGTGDGTGACGACSVRFNRFLNFSLLIYTYNYIILILLIYFSLSYRTF